MWDHTSDQLIMTAALCLYIRECEQNEGDYLSFCSSYNLDPVQQVSKVIYAHSWIHNNIMILIYRRLYSKDCRCELTAEELADVELNYPLFDQEIDPNRESMESLTMEFLALLETRERTQLLQMV